MVTYSITKQIWGCVCITKNLMKQQFRSVNMKIAWKRKNGINRFYPWKKLAIPLLELALIQMVSSRRPSYF